LSNCNDCPTAAKRIENNVTRLDLHAALGSDNLLIKTRRPHFFLFHDLDGEADGVELVVVGGVWEVADFVEEVVDPRPWTRTTFPASAQFLTRSESCRCNLSEKNGQTFWYRLASYLWREL